jgi:hypothetical protein
MRNTSNDERIAMVNKYKNILFVHSRDARELSKALLEIERTAFLDGYYFAFVLRYCHLCKSCTREQGKPCPHDNIRFGIRKFFEDIAVGEKAPLIISLFLIIMTGFIQCNIYFEKTLMELGNIVALSILRWLPLVIVLTGAVISIIKIAQTNSYLNKSSAKTTIAAELVPLGMALLIGAMFVFNILMWE